MSPTQDPPATQPSSPPAPATHPEPALDPAERLFEAARTGNITLLHAALSQNPGIKNLTNSAGNTLLMLASYYCHVELTRVLVQQFHADPNILNDDHLSPLAGAVYLKEPEILRLLLEAGADPDLGWPSAEECMAVFCTENLHEALLEEARERIRVEGAKTA